MGVSSMRGRLGLLLLAFVFLVSISIGATFWAINTQAQDARIINLSGRQRMLIQQITRLAPHVALKAEPTDQLILEEAIQTFELTLIALQDGGTAPYFGEERVTIEATRNPDIRNQLDMVKATWGEFHHTLDQLALSTNETLAFQQGLTNLEIQSDQLLKEADQLVRLYEQDAVQKLNRLRALQTGFLLASLTLLVAGSWNAHHDILRPLQHLVTWADQIGSGALDARLEPSGPDEVRSLGVAFQSMQSQLQASRTELVTWGDNLEKLVAKRTQELEALYDVSREISAQLDATQVLDLVVAKACQLLGAETATICLTDQAGEILEIQAHSGPREAIVSEISLFSENQAGRVLAGSSALNCQDGDCEGGCAILAPPYRASHLAAPLRVGERVIGALCVGSATRDSFDQDAVDILTKLGNAAAIALENAHLYTQVERLATLEERRRIAAEMHDGLGQTLSYLGLIIDEIGEDLAHRNAPQAVAQLERAREAIDQATGEVREAITQLLEEVPLARSLQEQLAALAEEFDRLGPARVFYEAKWDELEMLPRKRMEQVLRVATEALTNAQRHAGAEWIHLTLAGDRHDLRLVVEDNGRGFRDDLSQQDGRGHYGLPIMRARAAYIGGEVTIRSQPKQGTLVEFRWPRTDQKDGAIEKDRLLGR